MDVTLKQYLKCADDIHAAIVLKKGTHNMRKVKNSLYELESYIKQMQTVSCRIAQIYNLCKKSYNESVVMYKNPIRLDNIDPLPKKDNWTSVIRQSTAAYIAPNIPVNVHVVDSLDEIPNTPLYWVKSSNQFAIHVNGVILRGNIGNIYVNSPKGSNNHINVNKCKHANKCPHLLGGKRCKFYHDPEAVSELHKAQKITDEIMDLYRNSYQNFTNISWLYTDDSLRPKNSMMRFVGNRNTLKNELDVSKLRGSDWVDKYKSQMFHDFLVVMAINQKGLMSEYPNVQMVSDDYSGESVLIKNIVSDK